MVGEASRAIENVSASLEFKMHALKKCLLKMHFFFGPSLGPPAFASALPRQASGPRLGPQKSIFSPHFSNAGIFILETQNIYSTSDLSFSQVTEVEKRKLWKNFLKCTINDELFPIIFWAIFFLHLILLMSSKFSCMEKGQFVFVIEI